VVGFTEEPELAQLAQIAHERGLPLVDDLGSGSLIPLRQYGLADEPTVPESIGAGADLVTFSGDKLLGGPQAGLLAGKFVLIERLQRHPLMRVVRLDKLTLAALEATLRLYRDPARALEQIPTLAALTASTELLRKRAENLARTLAASGIDAVTEPGVSQVGGGSLPGEQLPTTLVSVAPRAESAAVLAHRLRSGTPSVWGRIRNDRLLLDLRTVNETELAALAARLREAVPSDG
jgi:L-seryl-tRNA(Ser) seleniumtransferase